MKTIALAAFAVALSALSAPSFAAKPDCYGGYKTFLGKVNPYIGKIEDVDLPTLMRRGLSVYDACEAGDNFVPEGAWNQVIFDMEAKAKK
jgi:hypothetical protein